jgi:hypothetical protein
MALKRRFKGLVQRHETADRIFGKELIASLAQACEHAERQAGAVRVHMVEVPHEQVGPRWRRHCRRDRACSALSLL